MAEIDTPTKQRAEAVRLWPLPADHPSQSSLREDERDEALARSVGAQPQDDGSWALAGEARNSSEAKRAERKLGTRSAQRRYERAVASAAEGDWRHTAARAANAEVEARGETPVRPVPSQPVPEESRTYFFTTRESDSPYHCKKLDAAAREAGVALMIDRRKHSETSGLRYMEGEPPSDLAFFRTEAARAAQKASLEMKRSQDATMQSAANTMAPANRQQMRPLTLPDPKKDLESFKRVRDGIRRIGSARLEQLIAVTEREREEIRDKEDQLVVEGKELPPRDKHMFGLYSRGLKLGRKVLEERQTAQGAPSRGAEQKSAAQARPEAAEESSQDRRRRTSTRRSGHDLEQ